MIDLNSMAIFMPLDLTLQHGEGSQVYKCNQAYKCNQELPGYELALVVVYHKMVLVLEYIGPGLEYLKDDGFLEEHLKEAITDEVDGVYLWKGILETRSSWDYYNGDGDCEEWLEGTFTKVTEEEWKLNLEGEYLWDPTLWLLSKEETEELLAKKEVEYQLKYGWPPTRFQREPVV